MGVELQGTGISPGRGRDGAGAKKSLQHAPDERLYWRVLKAFGALPSQPWAKELTEEELLWCALQLELDQEEWLQELCPACRAEAERRRCPACGVPLEEGSAGVNQHFDQARFEALKRGERDG